MADERFVEHQKSLIINGLCTVWVMCSNPALGKHDVLYDLDYYFDVLLICFKH